MFLEWDRPCPQGSGGGRRHCCCDCEGRSQSRSPVYRVSIRVEFKTVCLALIQSLQESETGRGSLWHRDLGDHGSGGGWGAQAAGGCWGCPLYCPSVSVTKTFWHDSWAWPNFYSSTLKLVYYFLLQKVLTTTLVIVIKRSIMGSQWLQIDIHHIFSMSVFRPLGCPRICI